MKSTSLDTLENPDNLVLVLATGDVLLQEDSSGENFVRGVNRRGEIYDFTRGLVNGGEFCGGRFSLDGKTFFVNRQGERTADPLNPTDGEAGLTYAIWGSFAG